MIAISALLNAIDEGKMGFVDVIGFIDANYRYTPVAFTNGTLHNEAGVNENSAKIFAFAQLNGLNVPDTLRLFCEHYQAVLAVPNGNDHANIRHFMYWGWQGFAMPVSALVPRT